ncbi:MAG TPA: GatB/YqeY domain-containing protein [Bacilli bacterium]|nr:GatB/YqeY domain-containing protein [Bacilli bacterium]
MLIDDLKKANVEALKSHDKDARAILSVVINKAVTASIEARAQAKDFLDADVLKIITKTIKELDDEENGYRQVNNTLRIESIQKQKVVISQYLPKMLTEEEIREKISKLDDKSLPSVMKYFKINFAGQVDMGLVSSIARSL